MLPDAPGSYVLILRLSKRTPISVGKLGEFVFPSAWYAYAGSARGPGGLGARVARHHRGSETRHWHIDYVRPHTELIAVWYALGSGKRECQWAAALSELPGAFTTAPHFGSSDCRCPAHLIGFPSSPDVSAFAEGVDGPISRHQFVA